MVLLFNGIAPKSLPGHCCQMCQWRPTQPEPCVFGRQLMYVSKPFRGRGGGGLQHAHYVLLKKKVLSVHYVPTTRAPTRVVAISEN